MAGIALITAAGLSALAADSRTIDLSVTTHLGDAQTFVEGDMVSFYVSLDTDAYLSILYQDAGGGLEVLLPNALYADTFFKAGLFIPIPDEQTPYQFRVTAPFGRETLWVFASDIPLPSLSSNHTGPLAITSVRGTFEKHCRERNAAFAQTSLTIETKAATTTAP